MFSLRPYQESAVVGVREALRRVWSALLVLATGAGKTVVFSYIALSSSGKGRRVLILAHRDTLLKQASNKLTDYGVDHGMIMPAFTPQLHKLVQVASVQTLARRIDKMVAEWQARVAKAKAEGRPAPHVGFDLVVVDEAHLSAAKSYVAIIDALRKLNPDIKLLGVTGSPARLDGKGLGVLAGGLYAEMVEGISIRELIEQAYLVRPVVYAPAERLDLSGIKKVGGDYDSQALAEVMDKPKITGSAIEHYNRICPGVPAVAWCANVAHAQHVAAEFNAAGIAAVAMSGEDDTAERDRVLADLSAGRVKVVTFAMLLVEGVDCPAIGAIIMLRPTMSLSSYLQTIGRGLRPIFADGLPVGTLEQRLAAIAAGPKGGKCFVLDHAGLTFKHGFADEDREWSLDGVAKKKGAKKKNEETLDLKQCPKCFVVHNPGEAHDEDGREVCPSCRHVYEVKQRKLEHVEGELAEITPEMKALIAKDRKKAIQKAKTLEELQALGKELGYSEGWAVGTFRAKERIRAKYRRPEPPIEVYEQDFQRR